MCVWQQYWENYPNKTMPFWTTNWLHWLRHPPQFFFISVSWEMEQGCNGEEIGRHLFISVPSRENDADKKREGVKEVEWSAGRQTGTFQTRLHKSWVWQLISNSQSTCPDIRSRSTYYSTHALPILPRLHLSLSDPPDLFDLYLFIAIAAAASTLTEQNTPVIRHKNAEIEIWS